MIYVDPLVYHGMIFRGKSVKTCHMWSDNIEELNEFAVLIGMKEKWLQCSRMGLWHYDLMTGMRQKAIEKGAKSVSRREAVMLWKQHK